MISVPTDENRITYFAETDARNKRTKFGIKAKDRTKHVYVIGKTGMGKSTLLENMAVQDIQNGEGMAFIDPHGKTADLLLEYVPQERIKDVIHIAPFDVDFPISFNVLESVDPTKRHLVVSGLMSTFKKIWVDAWSARMEYILTNTLLALLEAPNTTLLGVNRMLSDKEYRKEIVSHITDPSVKAFWVKEFANYTERQAAEAVPAIQNKVGQFTANPLIRNMIGQPVSSFDFREAMDSRKIIIINLSKGRIGDENMKLLGGLLVTKIYLAAMSRADVSDRVMNMLPNFYLFVDEFQNFANASFADILSEARKYKLNLTIAHQYIEQMDEIVRPAVFGNVGTMIAFRVGATDGEVLEQEFAPVFTAEDLVNLGFAQIYLKLMIDGLGSQPFSARTLGPIPHPDQSYVKEIIDASRTQFAKSRADVEAEIVKFHEPVVAAKKPAAPAAAANIPVSASDMIVKSQKPAPVVAPVAVQAPKDKEPSKQAPPNMEGGHGSLKDALSSLMTQQKPSVPASTLNTSVPKQANVPVQAQSQTLVLKSVSQKPIPAEPVLQPKPAPTPIVQVSKPVPVLVQDAPKPVAAVPAPIQSPTKQTVPLSSLSAKPAQPKQDPKIASPQNVAALKDALAAALKKGAPETKPAPQASDPAAPISTKSVLPVDTVSQPLTSTKDLKPVPKMSMEPTSATPAEVPEDVLKQVLKVE